MFISSLAMGGVTADFTISPGSTVCYGTTITFTDNSSTSGGTTIVSWSWDFDDTQTGSGSSVTHNYANTGTYDVTLTVTGNDASTSTKTYTVTVNGPKADFTFTNPQCEGSKEVEFTNASTSLGSSMAYAYRFNGGAKENAIMPNGGHFKTLKGGTHTVEFFATDLNTGCKDSITKTITIHPGVTIIMNSTPACEGTAVTVDANSTTNQSNIAQWRWLLPNGSIVLNQKSITHTFNDWKADTVWLTITTNQGCVYARRYDVGMYPNPELHVTVRPTCRDSLLFVIDSSNYFKGGDIDQWEWDWGDGGSKTIYDGENPRDTLKHGYNTEGLKTITVTLITSNACKLIQSFTADLRPLPKTDFDFANSCMDTSIQFTDISTINRGTVNQWLWLFGDTINGVVQQSFAQHPKHKYEAPGKYTVKLTTWSDYSCKDSLEKTITVYPMPEGDFTFISKCAGVAVEFYDESEVAVVPGIANDAIVAWRWDFGDGSPISTDQNPTHVYTEGGLYNVKLVSYSSYGCPSDTVIKSVVVYPAPTVSFTYTGECQDDSIVFTPEASIIPYANDELVSYEWNFSNQFFFQDTLPNKVKWAFENLGKHWVSLRVVTDKGCSTTFIDTVDVIPSPDVKFTNTAGCVGRTVQFTDQSTIGPGATITGYEWNFDDGTPVVNTQNPSHIFQGSKSTYNVTLTVTSSNGCIRSLTKTVVVSTIPTADFTFNNTCLDNDMIFTDATTGGLIKARRWYFGDNNSIITGNQTTVSHQYAAADTFDVMLVVVSNADCEDTVMHKVITYAQPVADFTYTTDCADRPIQFNDASDPVIIGGTIEKWYWQFGDGGTDTVENPTHSYNGQGGNYNVTLTVTNNQGCQNTITKQVFIEPLPNPFFTSSALKCINEPITFNLINNPPNIVDIHWEFDDGAEYSTQTVQHSFTTSGQHTVRLTVTNSVGCDSTHEAVIDVVQPLPITITHSGHCQNANIELSASGGYETYQWFKDGEFFGDAKTVGTTFPDTGTYEISVVGKNFSQPNSCDYEAKINLRIYPLPEVNFTATPVCFGQLTEFFNFSSVSVGEITKYYWVFEDGMIDSVQDPTHVFTSPGDHLVTLTVTTSEGCENTDSVLVTVYPVPKAEFEATPNPATIVEPKVTFKNTSKNFVELVKWSFGDGFTSTETNPTHTYLDTGIYNAYLVVRNENCTDTFFMDVFINEKFVLHAPTAFTPGGKDGGDGINDTWKPLGRGIQNYELKIYNRWGELMFQTTNFDDEWDGTYNGKRVPEGVYVYVVTIKDFSNENIEKFDGTVTVLW